MAYNKSDIPHFIASIPTKYSANFPQIEDNRVILNAYFNMEVSKQNQTFFSLSRQAIFVLDDVQNPTFNPIPYFFSDIYSIRKEEFLFTGIKNLRKNVKFLQLAKDLASKHITEDEFETEIENNPEKYLIDINPMTDPNDVILLHEIVNKIGDDLSIDEVGDIFSFDTESIKGYLNQLSK